MPPGGQIHTSILLKFSTRYISLFATRLQFIVYVNYEQERYYDFFQFVDMPLPPGGQIQKINMTEMLRPDRFHDFPQVCNLLCM